MAYKHIKEYYKTISQQYLDAKTKLKQVQEECDSNMISPERIKSIENNFRPLMENYKRWSYMLYLLNLPVKKSKQKTYENQNKKLLKLCENHTVMQEIEENTNCIKSIDKN